MCFASKEKISLLVYSTNVNVSLKGYEVDYNHCFNDYAYQVGAVQVNGHQSHSHSQPLPHTWNQDHPFTQGDNTYTSMGTDHSTETNDFSTDEYESKPYPQGNNNHMQYNRGGGQGDKQNHGDHNCRNHFEVSNNRVLDF